MNERNFWNDMNKMRRKMKQFFSYPDFPEREFEEQHEDYRRPLTDCREDENSFLIAVEIPGVGKEDLKVNLTDTGIEIKAEKRFEKEDSSCDCEDKSCTHESYHFSKSYSGFYRSIDLPTEADIEKIQADYRNGILKIVIPKKKSIVKKREVKIN